MTSTRPTKKTIDFGQALGVETKGLTAADLRQAIDGTLVSKVAMTEGTRTLSNEDVLRVKHVRSDAAGGANIRDLLNAAGIRPGCVVHLKDSIKDGYENRIFLKIASSKKAWVGRTHDFHKAKLNIVPYDAGKDGEGLNIELAVANIDGYLHSNYGYFLVQEAVYRCTDDRHQMDIRNAKGRKYLLSKLAADDIMGQGFGVYWREATFNKLLEEFLQTLTD